MGVTLRRAMGFCAVVAATGCNYLEQLDIPKIPDAGVDAGDGGTGGDDDDDDDGTGGGGGFAAGLRRPRVVSAAPSYTLVDERYSYRPRTNAARALSFALTEAPAGMSLRRGQVEWRPTPNQKGAHRVTLSGDETAEPYGQSFRVQVSTSTLIADGDVSTAGGSVFASGARASRVRGAGVDVPPNALRAGARLSVSEIDEAPPLPNSQGSLRAVKFGPAGTVFASPATVTLPLPESNVGLTKSALGAYVYDPAGRWRRAQVLAVDLDNHVMVARARHFSIYAAAQSSVDLEARLSTAPAASGCEGALLAQSIVTSPLAKVGVSSVNNLDERFTALVGLNASVQQLVTLPNFSGSLRAVQVFELVDLQGGGEVVLEQRLVISTLFLPGDGTATVTHADALGNALGSKQVEQPLLELDDLEARLRGAATAVRFDTAAGPDIALTTRLHLLYFGGDASLDPISVDDLGLATVERAPVRVGEAGPLAGDSDCDGLLDPYDGSDDSLVARIAAAPLSILTLLRGEAATLTARLVNGAADVTTEWVPMSDETTLPLLLTPVSGNDNARVFRASDPGRYTVVFTARGGTTRLEHAFTIDVLDLVESNTPPTCLPSKDIDVGRVGQAVGLTAVTGDAESAPSALRVEWGVVNPASPDTLMPSTALMARGAAALFSPVAPDTYTIGCRAYDGQATGPIGTASLTMVAANANRPPTDLTILPRIATVPVGTSVTFFAHAIDPDGDALAFNWSSVSGGVVVPSDPGSSAFQVVAPEQGNLTVVVTVTDQKSAALSTEATVQVDEGGADFDGDGWFAGTGSFADCDDSRSDVNPAAGELCNGIDDDCDGVIDESCTGGAQADAGTDAGKGAGDLSVCSIEVCNDRVDNDCDSLVDQSDPDCLLDGGVVPPPTDGGLR